MIEAYFRSFRRLLGIACLFLGLSSQALAQLPPPQWRDLSGEQRVFLLEAFQVSPELRQSFADGVPDEIKQNLLNTLWGVLTPEKRVQVALYAHIEKPWSAPSQDTAKVLAPQWAKLTQLQRFKVLEAAKLDPTQRAIFDGLPAELRQAAFEALWSYLDPKSRQRVLAP